MKKQKKQLILFFSILILTSCKNDFKTAVYEGDDISETAAIMRDKNTKDAELTINVTGKWTLYVGKSVDKVDYSKAFEGNGKGIFPLDIDNKSRSYFQLVTENGKAIFAERHLPMEGGYNFRDLGGIKNTEGKYIRWGNFLRTDELATLTDADLAYLSSIPVTSVVDFRTEKEIELKPDKLPSSVKNTYTLNIAPGNLNIDDMEAIYKFNLDSFMVEMNKSFVTDLVIINQYKKFFDILQNKNNLPIIFHCSAGKDRTGFGAALILFALGVDEEVIMKDYLSSNVYLKDKYADLIEKTPFLEPMFVVKSHYLQASINTMKEKYGSVDNYLTTVLKVDIPKFRQIYLY